MFLVITCNHIVYKSIYLSLQINLPESVIKRHNHSMATCEISNGHVWIIVTGGCRQIDLSNNTNIVITGSDVTFIIELGMIINNIYYIEAIEINATPHALYSIQG